MKYFKLIQDMIPEKNLNYAVFANEVPYQRNNFNEPLVQERLLHQTWYDENFDNLIPEEITWKQIDLPARIDVFERKRRQKLCTNSVSDLRKFFKNFNKCKINF